MISNISSAYKSSQVIKDSSTSIKTNSNQSNSNVEFSIEDKAKFNNYKKSSVSPTAELLDEKREFINPITTSLGFVLAFLLSLGSSATYNEKLYVAFSNELNKCKKFFDKYGIAGDIDFLGNISAPKKET